MSSSHLTTPSPSVIAAFGRGDPDGVRAFYHDYRGLVFGVSMRVLGRTDLAEDATQQTFVRAWQAADRLDLERDPAPWLAQIAKRVAIDLARSEARRTTRELGTRRAAPDDRALDLQWRVRRAIDELPRVQGDVLRLQHLDGLTHDEIADRLGIAVGTVKSRSHRAHRTLAEQFVRAPASDQGVARAGSGPG
jgi:RNA polymerase sigma factor (sigma-70 family)